MGMACLDMTSFVRFDWNCSFFRINEYFIIQKKIDTTNGGIFFSIRKPY